MRRYTGWITRSKICQPSNELEFSPPFQKEKLTCTNGWFVNWSEMTLRYSGGCWRWITLALCMKAGFGSVSDAKIKVACAAGWKPEGIVSVIMLPRVPIVESGPESENLKEKLGYFESLANSEDSDVAAVGRAGCLICEREIDRAMHRERDEDVYGIGAFG